MRSSVLIVVFLCLGLTLGQLSILGAIDSVNRFRTNPSEAADFIKAEFKNKVNADCKMPLWNQQFGLNCLKTFDETIQFLKGQAPLSELEPNICLSYIAYQYAIDMAAQKTAGAHLTVSKKSLQSRLSHFSSSSNLVAAEAALVTSYGLDRTEEYLVADLVIDEADSTKSHRKMIMNPKHTQVGVGFYKSNGLEFMVQAFAPKITCDKEEITCLMQNEMGWDQYLAMQGIVNPCKEEVESNTPDQWINITVEEPNKNATEESIENSNEEDVNNATEEPVENAEEPIENNTDEIIENYDEEPSNNATEEPVNNATEEPADNATEEPVNNATEEPVDNATEEPADNATEEPSNNATEEPADNATEEPISNDTIEELNNNSIEESTVNNTTEEPVGNITQPEDSINDTIEQNIEIEVNAVNEDEEPANEELEELEEPAKNATEEPSNNATEEPADNVTEEPADNATEEPADNATEEPADNVTEEPADNVTEEPADNATEEEINSTEKLPENASEEIDNSTEEPEDDNFTDETEDNSTPDIPTCRETTTSKPLPNKEESSYEVWKCKKLKRTHGKHPTKVKIEFEESSTQDEEPTETENLDASEIKPIATQP